MLKEAISYENTHTMQELVDKSVALYYDRDILRYEINDEIHSITYGEFKKLSRKVGEFINERRNEQGEQIHVGIIGEACANYVITLMGIMASGNVAVPLDHQLTLDNLADCLNRADIDILFFSPSHIEIIGKVKKMCPRISEYLALEPIEGHPSIKRIFENDKYDGKSWGKEGNYKDPAPDDLAMILFTSGTTGKSKGVMLTNKNLVGNALSQSPIDNDEFDEIVILLILPLHHAFCINVDIVAMMNKGATVCINGPISMLGKHLSMFEPTVLHIVPMITKVLYNKIKAIVSAKPELSEKAAMRMVYGRRLGRIVCGGGGLPEDLAKKYQEMGIRIGQGYGMSECSPVISEPDFEKPEKVSSAGRVLEHVDIRVGENGEIQIKSPFVMKGYYKDPERTQETFTEDGWLKTGDVGYVDDEEFVFLTGRMKNLIILSNGENVAPEEIENIFGSEPLIRDIIVFDEDDMIKCEILPDFSYAEAASIKDITKAVEAVVARHNNDLPTFKRINEISIRREPFVKTTSNKIIRQAFFDERKNRSKTEVEHCAPENKTQAHILTMVKNILPDAVDIGIDDNLYAYGLESLSTLELAVLLDCAPNVIYENKTIRKIADQIGVDQEERIAIENENLKEKNINKEILQCNKMPFKDKSGILVTGATGYLGSHIIKELVKFPNPIYCLIRSEQRFERSCAYYGIEKTQQIIPILGDVTEPSFGLSVEQYKMLEGNVSSVFHVAASVSHAGNTEKSYKINVEGTERVIDFCKSTGAQMYHMSSFAVTGFGTDNPLTEDVLDIGQIITENPYIQTKYQAEEKVLKARSEGVESTIFRIGNLTKRAADGLFQINENDSGLLGQKRAFEKLGVYPESMERMMYDDTPVDLAAKAIIKLARENGTGKIWHIMSPFLVPIKEFSKGEKISDDKFKQILLQNSKDRDVSFLSMYYRMIVDGLNTNFNMLATVKELENLGFVWN